MKDKNLTSLSDILDNEYGRKGTEKETSLKKDTKSSNSEF